MKFYRAKIRSTQVSEIGICAANIQHACDIAKMRMEDYGHNKLEYKILSVRRDGVCTWDLGESVIYY